MQATAQQIATIVNATTETTGMTAGVYNGQCFVHIPVLTSEGFGYEVRILDSEEMAHHLVY